MSEIREGSVQANGLEFAYLEQGEGPLVLLLHGFPDNAHTWSYLMPALAEAGYRAVAPFMRGYPPTTIPADGRYDPAALADDVAGLVDALGGGEPALVVGHDWGALTTYAAVALHPEKVTRAAAIGIAHPGGTPRIFEHPELLQHAFHFWLFQLPVFAEVAVRTNDFALIDYLWRLWSPGHEDPEHIKGVKETLGQPNAVEAALGYYRAFPQFPLKYPDLAQRVQFEPLTRPTLTVFGVNDPARVLAEGDDAFFAGEHRSEVIDGAGHFVQREQPEALTKLVLEWLKG